MAGRDLATCAVVQGGAQERNADHTHRARTADGEAGRDPLPYLQETWHAAAGWARVIGGYAVAVAGSLVHNDRWRRRGTRAHLVGLVQCRLGASVAAIERVLAR